MNVAKAGDKITWINKKHKIKLTGTVRKIYVNAVLVDLDPTENINKYELFESTIVAHKNYKIIQVVNS